MRRRASALRVSLPAWLLLASGALAGEGDAAPPWKVVHRSDALLIRCRALDRGVRECQASGVVRARPAACRAVLEDVESFPDFMPHVEEARVLVREADVLHAYQLIDAPFAAPRDYALRVESETIERPDGTLAFRQTWSSDDTHAPEPRSGTVRVTLNEGFWLFEPHESEPDCSRVTYHLRTDPGGRLPAWVIRRAHERMIKKLYAAIERRARGEPAGGEGDEGTG